MTTPIKASRFRIRRPDPVAPHPVVTGMVKAGPTQAAAEMLFGMPDDGFGSAAFPTAAKPADTPIPPPESEIDAIRREGLTGRQLRLARRMAQLNGLPATSDFDAVRLLRLKGLDPFARAEVATLVDAAPAPARAVTPAPGDVIQLPQTVKPIQVPSTEVRAENSHAADILRIQQDIMRRRRRKSLLLMARLAVFVMLPTLIAGYYFYFIATPMYEAKSAFIIQQADGAVTAGGIPGGAGLFGGAIEANKEASGAQDLLQSRDGLQRLDADLGFIATFQAPNIDPIQRLPSDASFEEAYKVYQRMVQVSYDPTEGLIRLSAIAPDPDLAVAFNRALTSYAESEIDRLSQRKRDDQMRDAQSSYENAEAKMLEAQATVVALQEQNQVLSSEAEVTLISGQIGQLETQLSTERLALAQMESNENPNEARMDPIRRRI